MCPFSLITENRIQNTYKKPIAMTTIAMVSGCKWAGELVGGASGLWSKALYDWRADYEGISNRTTACTAFSWQTDGQTLRKVLQVILSRCCKCCWQDVTDRCMSVSETMSGRNLNLQETWGYKCKCRLSIKLSHVLPKQPNRTEMSSFTAQLFNVNVTDRETGVERETGRDC